jgi:hypothetical protein
MAKPDLTAQRLREVLHYDPETGVFTWIAKASKNTIVGSRAGCVSIERGKIRRLIRVNGTQYFESRLAWRYMTGHWPVGVIDHKDGNSERNAFLNLRDVTQQTNLENQRRAKKQSRSGLLGARQHRNKFQAVITVNGKFHYLGVFDTAIEAHNRYLEVKRVAHLGCTI